MTDQISLLAKSREPDSQSALIRSDEWNRNTPAVHPTGRSAKLPGGLCASRRQVQSGRRQVLRRDSEARVRRIKCVSSGRTYAEGPRVGSAHENRKLLGTKRKSVLN